MVAKIWLHCWGCPGLFAAKKRKQPDMANADNLQTITSISFLPKKVVSKVLARVTVSSSIDLFRAKVWYNQLLMIQTWATLIFFTCDFLFSFMDHNSYVVVVRCFPKFRKKSIFTSVCPSTKFEIIPWRKNHKVSMFLNKCRRSKNSEALYRKGVVIIMVFC